MQIDFWTYEMNKYKTTMIGLSWTLKVDNRLLEEHKTNHEYLLAQYRLRSLIHFCNYGVFLD